MEDIEFIGEKSDIFSQPKNENPYYEGMTGYDEQMHNRYEDEYMEGGEFDEFSAIEASDFANEPVFTTTYAQLEQISRGQPGLGMGISGKKSKIERILQQQTISKEKLYLAKFAAELSNYLSDRTTQYYVTLVETKIPRFWLKNIDTLVVSILLLDQLKNKNITAEILDDFSTEYSIRIEDLYRYYRLVKEYIK